MKARDGSGGQVYTRESWLSAPLSDPNAALWASITPPANPNLATLVRRRAATFSLDLLAQRLFLRFPAYFASRATARIAILSASVAAGAAVGVLGYLSLFPSARAPVAAAAVSAEAPPHEATRVAATAGAPARHGQTEVTPPAHGTPPTLASAAPAREPEQIVQRLLPSADAAEPSSSASTQAKRSAAKKRSKATARRASKRRARAAND